MPARFSCAVRIALCTAAALLCGCPDASATEPPKRACTKAYEQCALDQGLLGVCNPVDCPPSQPGPCFVCRPQH